MSGELPGRRHAMPRPPGGVGRSPTQQAQRVQLSPRPGGAGIGAMPGKTMPYASSSSVSVTKCTRPDPGPRYRRRRRVHAAAVLGVQPATVTQPRASATGDAVRDRNWRRGVDLRPRTGLTDCSRPLQGTVRSTPRDGPRRAVVVDRPTCSKPDHCVASSGPPQLMCSPLGRSFGVVVIRSRVTWARCSSVAEPGAGWGVQENRQSQAWGSSSEAIFQQGQFRSSAEAVPVQGACQGHGRHGASALGWGPGGARGFQALPVPDVEASSVGALSSRVSSWAGSWAGAGQEYRARTRRREQAQGCTAAAGHSSRDLGQ